MSGTGIDAGPNPRRRAGRNRRLAGWVATSAALLFLGSPLAIPPTYAYTSAPLTGTFTEMFNPVHFESRGGYTIITLHNTGQFAGTLSGPTQEIGTAVVSPDGTTTLVVRSGLCQCTFAGQSGLVRFTVRTTVTPTGFASGQVVFTGESGGLSGLAGSAQFQGFGNTVNLSGHLILP